MERFRASVDAVRRGEEPPEDGYHGDVHRRAGGRATETRCRGCSSRSRRRSSASASTSTRWALQSELESAARVPAAAGHVREGRRRLGPLVGVRRRGRPRSDPLGRAGRRRRPTAPPTSSTSRTSSSRGFDRAIYVLGADHHGTRQLVRGGRADARLRPGAGRGAALPARPPDQRRRSRRRCRSGAATSSSSTSFIDEVGVDAARWYLVNRGPDQTIEIDVDLAAERTQKNPVYYVQYAHARIAGILRNAGGETPVRAEPPGRAGVRGAGAGQAACGVPGRRRRGDRAARPARDSDLCDPRRGRLPPLLPRAKVLGTRGGGVPARRSAARRRT